MLSMPHPRPSAWALIGVLLATILFSSGTGVVFAAQVPGQPQVANPGSVCSPGQLPTGWKDELHPPTSIRVLRSRGPSAGHVQTVDFWKYVGVVMRAEYSTGANKPPLWMRMGAITVKQYGWYKAMFWGGGRVSFTTTDPNTGITTTTTECFDVKDGTADQIYKPTETWPDGTIFVGNDPTPNIVMAMRETWQITLRKWNATQNKTRLFLTGYRSGKKVPCGADSTGFKIYQQSLRDCSTKQLDMYETLRRYFEPTYIVNTRDHDMLADGGAWRGDLGVLSDGGSGNTAWRLYGGSTDKFAPAVTGTFNGLAFSSLVGYGAGNVDSARSDLNNGAGDNGLLADLIMVTGNSVLVARATGNGLSSSLISTPFSGSAPRQMVVGDFNGDLLSDVGLIRSNSAGTTLQVMLAKGDGTFAAPVDWWSGPLDLSQPNVFVSAGDVNGDGKDDLIARDSTGAFQTALSAASCSSFSSWGVCPTNAIGAPGLGALIATPSPSNVATGAKLVVGDFDRDGRADVLAVAADGTSILGMRGKSDGTFADPMSLWTGSGATGQPIALNIDPDGMSDIAFLRTGAVAWFRTNEKGTGPASMTPMTTLTDNNIPTSGHPF